MNAREIGQYRLLNQHIALQRNQKPADVVSALGAMQAQDYSGSLWSLGVRLPKATENDMERAMVERTILRTWPMRGTLHLIAATDARWMLELLTPRIIAGSTTRWQQLELTEKIFERSRKLFLQALEGDRQLPRDAMLELLSKDGITMNGQRGYHILWRLAQEGTICFGARSGKEHTFALLDEWAPAAKSLKRDAALAELARRYFTSHGPVTLQDFAGWSGLKMSDARMGLESVASELTCDKVDGADYWRARELPDVKKISRRAYLLSGFDEFILGYKDRDIVLEKKHAQKIVPGSNGVFKPTVILDGQVAGTWKRTVTKKEIVIAVASFSRLDKSDKEAITDAAQHYGEFLGLPAKVKYA